MKYRALRKGDKIRKGRIVYISSCVKSGFWYRSLIGTEFKVSRVVDGEIYVLYEGRKSTYLISLKDIKVRDYRRPTKDRKRKRMISKNVVRKFLHQKVNVKLSMSDAMDIMAPHISAHLKECLLEEFDRLLDQVERWEKAEGDGLVDYQKNPEADLEGDEWRDIDTSMIETASAKVIWYTNIIDTLKGL